MTPQQANDRPEYNLTDDETALYEAMSEISEDCWCAGWMSGNEYSLWSALQDGELKYGMGFMDKPLLAKVAALSVQTGKWIVWRDDDSLPLDQHGPYAIDLSEWSAIYDGKNDLSRAPAPTEPAVDRDAVEVLRSFWIGYSWKAVSKAECEAIEAAFAALATPASPAVPGEMRLTEPQMHALAKVIAGRVAKNASVAPELCFAPALFALQDSFGTALQVAQASQPTSAEGKDSERLD